MSDEPRFKKVPTRAYQIRRRKFGEEPEETRKMLRVALTDAIALKLAVLFNDLDQLLRVAEPFVDQDVLKAHILADGNSPPGRKYGLAVVPGNDVLDATRWYLCPLSEPLAVALIVAVTPDIYAEFRKGWDQGYTKVVEMQDES